MAEPVDSPAYWAERLAAAREKGELHQAVFICPGEKWKAIEAKHREILAKLIGPNDRILDAGCAWGRLLGLLPEKWQGTYLGIDLSPDFIKMARELYPHRLFLVGDLRNLPDHLPNKGFDWGILISIKPMVVGQMGQAAWEAMEQELRLVCNKLLFLEYNEQLDEVWYEVT